MEALLNAFGFAAWVPVVFVALPLGVAGLMVRRRAQRQAEALAATTRVEGVWRVFSGAAVVERDDGSAVLVARDHAPSIAAADAIADGTRVLVVGIPAGDGEDPRGGGYRGSSRLARLVAERVSADVGFADRAWRGCRIWSTVGAALFASAVAIAAMATMVAYRAVD